MIYWSGLWRIYGVGACVLGYHGIVDSAAAGSTTENVLQLKLFMAQIEHFRKNRRLVGFKELLSEVEAGRRPEEGSTVITFDDASASIFKLVAPKLHALNIPFSICVPAGIPDSGRSLWEYEVRYLVRELHHRGKLSLLTGALNDAFEACGLDPAGVEMPMRSIANDDPRHVTGVLKELLRQGVPSVVRLMLLDRLIEYLTPDLRELIKLDDAVRIMSWEEIRMLHSSGVHIVSHGYYHHPHNGTLTEEDRFREIAVSREAIRRHIGIDTDTFAWPEGIIDETSLKIGLASGYRFFLTTRAGFINARTKLTGIPRVSGEWPLPQVLWNSRNLS